MFRIITFRSYGAKLDLSSVIYKHLAPTELSLTYIELTLI
jgi:hypothetical protein